MGKKRYKITIDVFDEEPFFMPDKIIYEDVFVYSEKVTKKVLKDTFIDMLKKLLGE